MLFVHPVSSDMSLFDSWLMHPRVQLDHRQCLVSYASCSAQDKEVYDHERIDEHEGYLMRVSVHLCTLALHMVFGACSHDGDGTAGETYSS
jgi:hypothetical protein